MSKYNTNVNFFEQISTEEQAYWLGFIAADGSVTYGPKHYCLSISLAIKDRAHLEKFANTVGYSGNIRLIRNQAVRLDLYSKKLVGDLIQLGIVPSKTFKLEPWKSSEDQLQSAYWRGYFDGDGYLKIHKKPQYCRAEITGTENVCKAFKAWISQSQKEYTHINVTKYNNIWRAAAAGLRPAQTVAEMLYSGSSVFLTRKYQTSQELLAQRISTKIKHLKKEDLLPLREKFGSWEKVAEALNISRNGLYKHIKKLGIRRRKWEPKITCHVLGYL